MSAFEKSGVYLLSSSKGKSGSCGIVSPVIMDRWSDKQSWWRNSHSDTKLTGSTDTVASAWNLLMDL